jgi:hypothetical protein
MQMPHHSINKWHVWDSDMSEMVQADNFEWNNSMDKHMASRKCTTLYY